MWISYELEDRPIIEFEIIKLIIFKFWIVFLNYLFIWFINMWISYELEDNWPLFHVRVCYVWIDPVRAIVQKKKTPSCKLERKPLMIWCNSSWRPQGADYQWHCRNKCVQLVIHESANEQVCVIITQASLNIANYIFHFKGKKSPPPHPMRRPVRSSQYANHEIITKINHFENWKLLLNCYVLFFKLFNYFLSQVFSIAKSKKIWLNSYLFL